VKRLLFFPTNTASSEAGWNIRFRHDSAAVCNKTSLLLDIEQKRRCRKHPDGADMRVLVCAIRN